MPWFIIIIEPKTWKKPRTFCPLTLRKMIIYSENFQLYYEKELSISGKACSPLWTRHVLGEKSLGLCGRLLWGGYSFCLCTVLCHFWDFSSMEFQQTLKSKEIKDGVGSGHFLTRITGKETPYFFWNLDQTWLKLALFFSTKVYS